MTARKVAQAMSMMEEPDVVVIGAGAAGTGAARTLVKAGLKTLVLEALSRTGGRASTAKVAGNVVDLGCGWLHSGDRNPWTRIAGEIGITVDRQPSAWGGQFRDLGFAPHERDAAHLAFERWTERVSTTPPPSDVAADALDPADGWTSYLQALSGYISGDELERISCKDYAAYNEASTLINWRVQTGYGALVGAAMPAEAMVKLSTPVEAIGLDGHRIEVKTSAGTVRARALIVTVSTNILAGDTIRWPSAFDAWRAAAMRLPLGANEKLFLEITGPAPFEDETHLIGDPRDASTGSYYIRPFGQPVIECYLGGAGARAVAERGQDEAFARATDQLVRLFGSNIRRNLRPLVASDWSRTVSIGGAYSHALPGHSDARLTLAGSLDQRVFFAGEATHTTDFSTAHGALQSGERAAREVLAVLQATP
ncbi:NAD(P)/FAD-dependent oxidoreductase [Rhizobium sp. AN80A]|uniref:flavin monoamine oxidase family protein n=1 Tax=Rhizobium sp. AN80A TaxID=3040673 RepID=UPI0024B3C1EF|nr:NAD(P)/FAD-dependent oxidoreductase [Rhizobium sp. AN80A]